MNRIGILLAVALQTAALGWMIFDRVSILESGREVVLKAEPIDPRDLFRGDYVRLGYGISQIDLAEIEADTGLQRGDRIFVTLRVAGGLWSPLRVSRTYPTTVGADEAVIAGRVEYTYERAPEREGTDTDTVAPVDPATLHPVVVAVYGIEKYFVPEGAGRRIEDERNEGNVTVRVAVDSHGRAAIKGLLIDGQLVYEEGLF